MMGCSCALYVGVVVWSVLWCVRWCVFFGVFRFLMCLVWCCDAVYCCCVMRCVYGWWVVLCLIGCVCHVLDCLGLALVVFMVCLACSSLM